MIRKIFGNIWVTHITAGIFALLAVTTIVYFIEQRLKAQTAEEIADVMARHPMPDSQRENVARALADMRAVYDLSGGRVGWAFELQQRQIARLTERVEELERGCGR